MALSRREFIKHSAALLAMSGGIFGVLNLAGGYDEGKLPPLQGKKLCLPFALHTSECKHDPAYPAPGVHSPYPIYMPVINA